MEKPGPVILHLTIGLRRIFDPLAALAGLALSAFALDTGIYAFLPVSDRVASHN